MGRIIKSHGHVERAPVMQARDQAAAIVARARQEAEDARATGHALGLAAGRDEGLAQVTHLLASARADAEAVRRESLGAALALGRRMAEKIIGRAAALDESIFEDIVAEAVAESRVKAGPVTVKVHPDALAGISTRAARIAERAGGGSVIAFVPSDAVDRYGCIVETRIGRVDARLDGQLDALEKAIRIRSDGKPG